MFETVSKEKAKNLSVLVLAFVGDAVYTLSVREKLSENGDFKAGELNKKSADIVCARAQAEKSDRLLSLFTEEEAEIFRRGRNAKKGTRAKHATVSEYNASTGFEAVLGSLYLTGQYERLEYIVNYGEEKIR
ncbi:MAG TPA: hypothetical protein DDW54_02090 [Clostridiales bacterium]|nr:hypothetical protein [Clostridiales bacterium]